MVEVKLLGMPNEDLVQGFPGVPATWPRIMATVQLRPKDLKDTRAPLPIARVQVGLYRTDSVTSGRPSIQKSSRREQSFLVTKLKEIWTNAQGTGYALDIPFTLSLPTNRTMAGSIALPHAETTYHVFVSTTDVQGVAEQHRFPVRIRRFDTLSTFTSLQMALSGESTSVDHLVALEWTLPARCFGPRDRLSMRLRAAPNVDWSKARKVRVRRFSAELVQILRIVPPADDASAEEVIEKRRVCKTASESTEFEQELVMEIPGPQLEDTHHIVPKDRPDVPWEGRSGFSTACALFSVEFVLVLKARFSHAKDIETEVPLTISQFDHGTGMLYMTSIHEAAQLARYAERRIQPPKVSSHPLDAAIQVK